MAIVGWGIHAYNAFKSGQPIPDVPVVNVAQQQPQPLMQAEPPAPLIGATGWVPDRDANDTDARLAVFRNFADTPAGKVGDIPAQVFLWQAVEKLTGKPAPMKDQNPTGACVGFGSTTTCERSLAADIVHRGGDATEFTFFSEEVTYAGSKVQGARSLGATVSRQDGSAGVFVKAYFNAGYGLVPKGKYGSIDLSKYNAARAHSWNTSGPPADVLAAGKKYPVKDAAKVSNWEQAKRALASGYGVTVCAKWGASAKRDVNGVSVATNDGWNHCMALDGYIVLPNGDEYGHIENSWSDMPDKSGARHGISYHTGPTGWGNPTGAGFWFASENVDAALRQGDSYALSGVTGFPARKLPPLDLNIRNAPARPRDPLAFLDSSKVLAW